MAIAAGITVCATALIVIARAAKSADRPLMIGLLAAFLLLIAVTPVSWRGWVDWIPLVIIGLVIIAGNYRNLGVKETMIIGAVLAAVAGVTAVMRALIPGGVFSIVLGGLGLLSIVPIAISATNLARMRRATTLVRGAVAKRVGIGGTVVGESVISPPLHALDVPWWTATICQGVIVTRGELRIETSLGPVIIETDGATLDFSTDHYKHVSYDDLRTLVDQLDDEAAKKAAAVTLLPDGSERRDFTGQMLLHWLPKGADAYVVGTPEWERAVPELATYRDTPWVPVFRASGRKLHIADRPGDQARRDAWVDMAAWSACAAACAVILTLQRMGVA